MLSFLRKRAGAQLSESSATALIEPQWPTVFHITHHKAGSQWIHKILDHLAHDRIVPPRADQGQVLNDPLWPGRVYPTVYLTRSEFTKLKRPRSSFIFFMLRDMRDVLISLYFSERYSHDVAEYPRIHQIRQGLAQRSMEEGLLWFIEEEELGLRTEYWLEIIRSWLDSGVPIVRYEDLLERDEEILTDLLLNQAKLPVSREHLINCIHRNRFDSLTQGRKRGEEDIHAHERKGVAGDWRNHFTPRLKEVFLKRCGSILVETGYEQDDRW